MGDINRLYPGEFNPHREQVMAADTENPWTAASGFNSQDHDRVIVDTIVSSKQLDDVTSITLQAVFWSPLREDWVPDAVDQSVTFTSGDFRQWIVNTLGRICWIKVTAFTGTGASSAVDIYIMPY